MLPNSAKPKRNKKVSRKGDYFIFSNFKTGDKGLLMVVAGLLIAGLVVIYSSTVVHSQNVFNDPYRFVVLQLGWILISLGGFFFFYNFNYDHVRRLSYVFMGLTVFFLFILSISGILPCAMSNVFMPCINEANRWFILNPLPLPQIPIIGELGFQPSEFAKLSLILFLSANIPVLIKSRKTPFVFYLIATGLVSLLVLLQPNMSTAVTLFLIGSTIYFCSGASLKPVLILAPIGLVLAILFILTSPYRRERLMTFVQGHSTGDDLSSGYQIKQVSIALGNGGLFGVGIGQSKQKYYLPEVSSDSIFAIIGEEFGFIGSITFLTAYIFLLYRGFKIALEQDDDVRRLLCIGVTTWLGVQLLIHVSANSSLIPYTGVPIPLVSYGGSSMLFSLMGLGILAGLSKRS